MHFSTHAAVWSFVAPFAPQCVSVMYPVHSPLVPSAFTERTGKDHWEVLLRARAIENLAYVLAPAQAGTHGPGRASHGHAMIVDPWGSVLAQVPDGEGLAVAELDFDRQDRVRAGLPALRHIVLPIG